MLKILLLGNGQLARALIECSCHFPVQITQVTTAQCRLEDTKGIRSFVIKEKPDVIINAAAFTKVELAESQPDLAWLINAAAVDGLAKLASEYDILLVHISTDYVFGGQGIIPWCEEDQTAPLNVYGKTKRSGEVAIMGQCEKYLLFRTSWLHSPWRRNFIKSMLTLGMNKEHLSVVCDQIGAPTSACMLAKAILHAVVVTSHKPELSGLYHVAAQGETSWYDLAKYCFSVAGSMGMVFKVKSIEPVLSDDYPSMVLRPLNSRLNTKKFSRYFWMEFPAWQDDVSATLSSLLRQPEHR
ncbi:dTDP-4-dehydrorhamnose reductase [Aeromonas simiae]|uniref:dTDP-4-dehydrorhamnose reductase n=1 Tax=Aeromonas simiae TaxID=218936 RepID=A0A5J6WXQ2_9GAMM|nr:dTDP-4-dehydrorhamnose reductase [Aeromonas simiae]MDO2951800.1 dTDP-4-dehydrorhamnose reductase [Aeromonas simiae]QFI54991.1 dTDP-4-dehydrorhamnose reductase [Aeromonas simiae]